MRAPLPDPDSLRCFVALCETSHFRLASERVHLSPAAFSDRIKRLEEDLGVALFERHTRSVRLTDAARRLLPHARALLDEAARCAAVARDDIAPVPIELTLGTRYELGLSWLCPLIPELAAARPGRTIHLYMGDTDALIERLERGRVDAIVTSARLSRPHLRTARLHEETYTFVARADRAEPFSSPQDAAQSVLIDATPDLPLTRYLLDALPDGGAWRFGSYLYMGGIGGVRAAVLGGQGVAVLPAYFVAEDLAAGRLVALRPDLGLPSDWFRLVWRADHPREGELQRLGTALAAAPLR